MARTVVNVTASSTLDGRDISADGTKLDGIEANATADQTAAEIKSLVEASSDIALAGNPTTTTQSSGNNSTRIATTAFVADATSGLATDTNLANKAPIDSPTFTGTPAAPTASSGTNTTQIATTAFVTTAVAGATIDGISSSADATAITIDSSERVGVGTTSPTAKLHVTTGATGTIATFRGADTDLLNIDGDSNAITLDARNVGTFNIERQGTNALTIDSSANVGIGTTSPAQALVVSRSTGNAYLDVARATQSQGQVALQLSGGSGGTSWIMYQDTSSNDLSFYGNGSNRFTIDSNGDAGIGATPVTGARLRLGGGQLLLNNGVEIRSFDTGGNQKTIARVNTSDELEYGWSGSGPVKFMGGGSYTERMRIHTNGNVGIGTTSPISPLDVKGTAPIVTANSNVFASSGNGTGFGIYRSASGRTAGYTWTIENVIASGGSSGSDYQIDNLVFKNRASVSDSSLTERMRISSAGNVGIGTTSPTANCKLHIADADAQIELEGTGGSNSGFIDFDGTNLQLSTNRNMKDGTFSNTGKSNASILLLGPSGGSTIRFYTASANNTTASERMRIDTSGNLLIGKTGTNFSNDGLELRGGGDGRLYVTNTDDASTVFRRDGSNGIIQYFYRANSFVGSISVSTTSTAYNTSSDERLKENIVDASAGNIDAIRVRSFDWKADGVHQPHGMIAQELVDVAPEAVAQGETDDDMWQIDYSKLVPMMVKEIQDLRARVAQLEGG